MVRKIEFQFLAGTALVIFVPVVLMWIYHTRPEKTIDPTAIDIDFVNWSLVGAFGAGCLLAIPKVPSSIRVILGFIYAVLLAGPLLQLYGDLVSLTIWR